MATESFPVAIRVSIAAVVACVGLALWCLIDTTALSMTLFFTVGLPLYGFAVLLYLFEVLRDLRRHGVF
jgi:uncharacterized membrane protein